MPDPQPPSKLKKGAAWVTICVACVSGFEGLRTVAYRDPVGIPTICFGATAGVKLGHKKTVEECKDLLAEDIAKHQRFLIDDKCMGQATWERLAPQTQAAVVSLVYNTGPGKRDVKDGPCALKKTGKPSTMVRLFIAGRDEEACQQFSDWANPPLPGIIKRRKAEMELCLEGVKLWSSTESTSSSSASMSY